jgi:hypothetical protein
MLFDNIYLLAHWQRGGTCRLLRLRNCHFLGQFKFEEGGPLMRWTYERRNQRPWIYEMGECWKESALGNKQETTQRTQLISLIHSKKCLCLEFRVY